MRRFKSRLALAFVLTMGMASGGAGARVNAAGKPPATPPSSQGVVHAPRAATDPAGSCSVNGQDFGYHALAPCNWYAQSAPGGGQILDPVNMIIQRSPSAFVGDMSNAGYYSALAHGEYVEVGQSLWTTEGPNAWHLGDYCNTMPGSINHFREWGMPYRGSYADSWSAVAASTMHRVGSQCPGNPTAYTHSVDSFNDGRSQVWADDPYVNYDWYYAGNNACIAQPQNSCPPSDGWVMINW